MARGTLNIEGAKIFWRNFSGKGSKYNAEGNRNFCVEIDPETAEQLKDDGWNVKHTKPKDDGDEGTFYIPVTVSFGNYPPKIYKVTSRNKTLLDEELVGDLDRDELENVDLIISPYHWTVNTKNGVETGIKAYLKVMYATIVEDDFARKYAGIGIDEELPL